MTWFFAAEAKEMRVRLMRMLQRQITPERLDSIVAEISKSPVDEPQLHELMDIAQVDPPLSRVLCRSLWKLEQAEPETAIEQLEPHFRLIDRLLEIGKVGFANVHLEKQRVSAGEPARYFRLLRNPKYNPVERTRRRVQGMDITKLSLEDLTKLAGAFMAPGGLPTAVVFEGIPDFAKKKKG